MKSKHVLPAILAFFWVLPNVTSATMKDTTTQYKKPLLCITGSNRCVLKQFDQVKYWCLKDSKQLTLDVRRTTSPIKKTYRENLGHCAKILPILK